MTAKKISIPLLFGLIAACIMVLVVFGTWLAGPEAFVGWQVWLGKSLVILLAAMAATTEKRARGGILDFRSALRVAFGVIAMGIVANYLLAWLIVNVIDPHFYQRLLPILLKRQEQMDHNQGFTSDQIREDLAYLRTHNAFSVASMIIGMGRDLLLFGIIAILIAVTVKSKKGPTPAPRQ